MSEVQGQQNKPLKFFTDSLPWPQIEVTFEVTYKLIHPYILIVMLSF